MNRVPQSSKVEPRHNSFQEKAKEPLPYEKSAIKTNKTLNPNKERPASALSDRSETSTEETESTLSSKSSQIKERPPKPYTRQDEEIDKQAALTRKCKERRILEKKRKGIFPEKGTEQFTMHPTRADMEKAKTRAEVQKTRVYLAELANKPSPKPPSRLERIGETISPILSRIGNMFKQSNSLPNRSIAVIPTNEEI